MTKHSTTFLYIRPAADFTWHWGQLRGHVALRTDLLPCGCGEMKPPKLPEKRVVFILWPSCLLKVWVVASKYIQVGAVCNTAVSTAGRRYTVSCWRNKGKTDCLIHEDRDMEMWPKIPLPLNYNLKSTQHSSSSYNKGVLTLPPCTKTLHLSVHFDMFQHLLSETC